jgi:hypothetical protein
MPEYNYLILFNPYVCSGHMNGGFFLHEHALCRLERSINVGIVFLYGNG